MDMINDLHEMCETLGRALKKANEKIRSSGGELSASDMDYVNKLSHALKSIVTTAAMKEAEMEDGESYGYRGESYARGGGRGGRGGSYRGGSYDGGSYDGGSYEGGSYDGDSYARGRGRNARRDSQGRYSREGYSRNYSREGYSNHGEMVDELRELMEQAPDEQTRKEMERLVKKLEQQ